MPTRAYVPPAIRAQAAMMLADMPDAEPEEQAKAPPLPLLEWMYANRAYLKAGLRFDTENHHYLKGLYEDTCREIKIMKAGQMGVSEWAVSKGAYYAAEFSYNVLYLLPNAGEVSEFSATRFGPAVSVDASEYLASKVVGARAGGVDRVTLKKLGRGNIYFVGGTVSANGTAPQLHSKPADVLIRDERDLIDKRAIPLSEQRLGHSAVRIIIDLSTPTYKDKGIHAEYQASDRRKWFIKCPSCGKHNTPELNLLIKEYDDMQRPIAWNKDASGAPCLRCLFCGGEIDRAAPGEWVAELQRHEPHGYHISGLISVYKPLEDIIGVRDVNKPTGLQSLSESVRKEVINQGIGDPYTPPSAVTLDDATLDACRREYRLGPRIGKKYIAFCGIDVGRVLHVVIRSADWSLIGVEQCRWGDLQALLRAYRVVSAVMDSKPETTQARAMQALFPLYSFWLADYPPSGLSTIDAYKFDLNKLVVQLDRTRSLDAMYSLFRTSARGEPRGATLPASARDIADYYAHMKAPEREIEQDAKGNPRAVYREDSKADHYAHAENYCLAAAEWWVNPLNNAPTVQYDRVRIA